MVFSFRLAVSHLSFEPGRYAPHGKTKEPEVVASQVLRECLAKIPRPHKKDILHTIEVLENSFADIPPLWAEKLNSLKQQCRKGDDNTPRL